MRLLRAPGAAAIVFLTFAAPAIAQEDGVFIDPDSPSAKEYGIPLEAERRQADPAQEPDAGIRQGSRSSPIFGAGIVGDGERPEKTNADAPGSAGKKRERDAPREAKPRESDDDAVVRAAAANPGAPSGGAGVPLTIAGVAAGVLFIGGLAGLLLRRRARLNRP